ncbi:MAG: sigma-54 dependent transcriptional regulator [Planctomycetales bacterium]|nr:sigma-54 dependent transcriptional regulator [Planctomycetales bacterium]
MSLVLIVEDDRNARAALAKGLEKEGHDVIGAGTSEEALRLLREQDVGLVLSDVVMPGMDGMALLERVKADRPETVVVLMTAYGTIEKAVAAMKLGAYDFLQKPLDLEKVRPVVARALERHGLAAENRRLREELREKYRFRHLVGSAPPMQEIFQVVAQVAPSKASVLILGESGTGKELIANAIHYESPRSGGPFVKVNCAALSETLLESELFGHEKGAFTGAIARRKGRFEAAHGGTLFLDEIAEISAATQVKLLRVLQEHAFERVGGNETIRVDVRVIAATNADLDAALRDGKLREDLYYRLKVVTIHVPALRERRGDIPLLARHFLEKSSSENGKKVALAPEALRAFEAYDWPGNVRELENAVETAVVLARGPTIGPELFAFAPKALEKAAEPAVADGSLRVALGTPMADVERKMILATLDHVGGNKTQAAKVLGIGTRTLYRKLAEYGMGGKGPEDEDPARHGDAATRGRGETPRQPGA